MQASDRSTADLGFLVKQSNDLRDRIIAQTPHSHKEAAEKLTCLINLMRRDPRMAAMDPDLCRLLGAAAETCETCVATAPQEARDTDTKIRHKTQSVFGGSMADYVAFAEGRVSLIDTNYCYVATSEANAQFYGRQQISIMGSHMADVIGESLFQTRAKPRLDACFQGDPQTYHRAQNHLGSAIIVRCDMKPVNSSDGGIMGALVYLTDVTEQARRLRTASEAMVYKLPAQG